MAIFIDWESAGQTHVGSVRDNNEDAYLNLPRDRLWVIADGMGGYEAGEFASNAIIQQLQTMSVPTSIQAAELEIEKRLRLANHSMQAHATELSADVVGSTVVVMAAVEGCAICVWAGDSRLYRMRHGKLQQLSTDHSHVQELVNAGAITPQQARHHPNSNIVTRALGVSATVELESIEFNVIPDDIYVLCSDGLTGAITDQVIANALGNVDCKSIVDTLINQALAAGANDNVSVVVTRAKAGGKTQSN